MMGPGMFDGYELLFKGAVVLFVCMLPFSIVGLVVTATWVVHFLARHVH